MWRSGFFYNLDVADILSSDAEALLFTFEPDRSINRESVGKEFILLNLDPRTTADIARRCDVFALDIFTIHIPNRKGTHSFTSFLPQNFTISGRNEQLMMTK